jgi:RHS repeat-associated protein
MKRLWTLLAIWLALVVVACGSNGKPQPENGQGGEGGAGGSAAHAKNRAPVANAGPAQVVAVGDEVTLDGSKSTDPNGDSLTFMWKVVSQPLEAGISLSDSSAVRPTFEVSKTGSYVFELVVSDGELASEPARVSISTSDNRAPIADAGEDLAAKVGDELTLDGSASMDPDGDRITYAWRFKSLPDGSSARLSDAMAVAPTFTVDVEGDYVLELVVNDGALDSEPSSVTASTGNLPPAAAISVKTEHVLVDGKVSLDGTGSHDANGDELTYAWSITSKPKHSKASLTHGDRSQSSFVPDLRGDYVVQLIVNDGKADSEPETALVTPENRSPTADAGSDASAQVGDSVELDGSASSDPDHDDLTYTWKFDKRPSGSKAVLSSADSDKPKFVADVAGSYVVKLTVNDGDDDSEPDAVSISVTPAPPPPPPPSGATIAGFSPATGSAGTVVTVTGSGFTSSDDPVHVLVQTASGEVEATLVSATDGELTFVLPPGTTSGTFTIVIGDQRVESSTPLQIEPSTRFDLAVEPSSLALNPGVSVSAIVRLATTTGFADLADLSVDELPDGVTANFTPQKIRAGDWALLTLQAANDAATTELALTVRASAEIDAQTQSEAGALNLSLLPVSTAFVGRSVLDDPRETPLVGVTVTLLGKDGNGGTTTCSGTTTSDAAGNFSFTNLPAGCASTQLVRYDGLSVSAPEGKFAGVDIANDLTPGIATQARALVHLPRIDTAPTVGVKQNATADQLFTFPKIPNLSLTVYAGTTLTMPDGSTPDPFPLTAVPVPVDRLPEEVPQTQPGFHFFIVAFQPANAIASQPVAVSYPNELAFTPGTAMPLLTLDPDRGVMVQYGTGKVSDDGLQIVPDADPSYPGREYGIVHFDWHGPFANKAPPNNEPVCGFGAGCNCPKSPDSVSYATGVEHRTATDIGFGGGRGGISVVRMYRSDNTNVGPFGIGTSHNYHFQLSTNSFTAQTFNLIPPNGNVVPFIKQTDGTYLTTADPAYAGAIFSTVSGGSQLRLLNGTILGFQAFPRMGGSMLTSITDPNGNTVTLTRNAGAPFDITTIADPAGRQLTLSYDSTGRVTQIVDPIGRKVSYTYNSAGLLGSMTNLLGKVMQYGYTAGGQLATITDPLGTQVLTLTYDANGRVSSETAIGGGTTIFEYTVVNQSMPASPVVATKVTDASAHVSTYRFNPRGYLVSATDPLGQTNTLTREGGTNRLLETLGSGTCGTCNGATGHQVFEYDANGQLLKQTDEAGAATQFTYDSTLGLPTGATDALGSGAQLTYDTHGNLTQLTDALNRSSSFEYDSNGQVSAVVDANGKRSTFTYDGAGNLVSVTDPAGNVSRTTYDGVSRPIQTTDPLGRRTRTRYNDANQIVETIDAAGSSTKFTYDDRGNLTSLADPRGAITSYAYDTAGRLIARTDPLQVAEQFSYDDVGHLVKHLDRRGLTATFTYDALDRVTTATYADSSVSYRYDAQGNVGGITDTLGGDYTFGYDERNLLTAMQGPNGALGYAHDLLGRVTAESVTGQTDTLFTYDATGHYTRIETEGAGVAFDYDSSGRLTTETRDNGVVTHYTYDELGAVVGVRHELKGSDIDAQSYEHDGSGATTYATGTAHAALGTSEVTANYDVANRIQTWGNKTFSHDADGNRLQANDASGAEKYAWDARGRLTSITRPDGSVIELGYDFANNLARISTPDGDESLLNDASGNVVLRRTNDGTIQRMLSGLAMDHQVALLDSARGVRYPLLSRPNSTVATVDAKGIVDGQFSYEPYGETAVTQSATADYPFLFTGRTRVTDGLYYYRARFYDPLTSRFISEDPLGFGGGDLNLYRYVGGQPVDRVDPSGEYWWLVRILGGGLINVGVNAALTIATGGCYTWGDAGRDFLIGALSQGVVEAWKDAFLAYRAFKDARALNGGVEIVQRAMSRAELEATRRTGLLRGGREGEHFVSDAANSSASRARSRLALPNTPEERVTMEVPTGRFSAPSRVQPLKLDGGGVLPGGGMERTATGRIPVRILGVDDL